MLIRLIPSPSHASQRPPLALKLKRPGVQPRARLSGQIPEEGPDRIERAGVGVGIRARRASDGRLVDGHEPVEALDPVDAVVWEGSLDAVMQTGRQRPAQGVVDQGRLAAAGRSCGAYHQAEWDPRVDPPQCVAPRAPHDEPAPVGGAPRGGVGIRRRPERYWPVRPFLVRARRSAGFRRRCARCPCRRSGRARRSSAPRASPPRCARR